ncbi:unnamed protein product [Caenorhabditis angaria]|uniref:C4H2-type domain-containing protein n=1 Tax=Caenorhabditis angaria TaxID=860376 RepID=A0A9P1N0I8_9PELO|nr:unnamed protein product [Caenorhabditis angaria]
MEIAEFSEGIRKFQGAKEKIDEFFKTLEELQNEIAEKNELEKHIENCEKMSKDLEAERKSHAEELRQINQDINILEDISKSLRGEIETSKLKISKSLRVVKNARENLNSDLKNLNFEQEDVYFEPTQEEIKYEPKLLPFSFPSFLTSIFPSIPPPQISPITPNNLVNRHRLPPQFVEASKMKICENCGAKIHRNAPTCPMCKTKTKSKNPKRKRKTNDQFQL